MSTASIWLPPLNHHKQYTIYLTAAQCELPAKDSSSSTTSSPPRFAIRVHVHVGFYSDSGSGLKFEGLNYLTKEILVPCRALISSSPKKAKKILCAKLSDLGIPFRLHHVSFVQKSSGEGYFVSAEKRWIEQLQNFLRSMLKNSRNSRHSILPLNLTIDKWVTIPDRLHKGWRCWYYYSKKMDPDFEKKYKAAISRPRKDKELSCGAVFTFDQATTAVMKDVSVSTFGGLTDTCSVCLEELSNGKELKGLTCAHVFHDHCIKEWFRRSQVCPLCRHSLPFRIIMGVKIL